MILNLVRGNAFTIFSLFRALIGFPVLAVILLFVFAGLMMLVSEVTGGDRDWEIAVKGIASMFFIYPLALILNTLAFNCTSMWLISVIVDSYMLFLLYNIAAYCLHGKKSQCSFCVDGMRNIFSMPLYVRLQKCLVYGKKYPGNIDLFDVINSANQIRPVQR